eukprot:m.96084 g.96084  ORF g.96084 m.96084 type:complete len:67 (+) comp13062_c0_seq24:2422-2622(+)
MKHYTGFRHHTIYIKQTIQQSAIERFVSQYGSKSINNGDVQARKQVPRDTLTVYVLTENGNLASSA